MGQIKDAQLNYNLRELVDLFKRYTKEQENECHSASISTEMYDQMSKNKIFMTGDKEVRLYGDNIFEMIETLVEEMDSVIKEHPSLTYRDFTISTECFHQYDDEFGTLLLCYEWEESDEEFKQRQEYIKFKEQEDSENISKLISLYEKTYGKNFIPKL